MSSLFPKVAILSAFFVMSIVMAFSEILQIVDNGQLWSNEF